MKELITVVVPVYKVEEYIYKCVDSIINQTYKNLEIILVDDGSPDNCPKICDDYSKKDKRIKVIHKENGGLSDARNFGIENSKGKYICFVDSDDFIHEKYVEILYNNLKNNNADISMCHHYQFINYNETNDYLPEEETSIYTGLEILNRLYEDYLNNIVAWNKLYKKELFNNIKYPKGKKLEDAYIIHKLYNNSKKVVITNLELYYYIQRENSIMSSLNTNVLTEQDLLIDRIEYLEKNKLVGEAIYKNTLHKFVERLYDNYYYLNIHGHINPNLYKKYFKYIKKYIKIIRLNKKEKLMINHKYLYIFLRTIKKLKEKANNKCLIIKRRIRQPIYDLKYIIYKNKVREKNIIFNCPNHYNLGDHAILKAENEILKSLGKNIFNVYSHYTEHFIKKYSKTISTKDHIYITGGGNLGTLWTNEQDRINIVINNFNNKKITIFPQTIYYSNNIYGKYRLEIDKKRYNKCSNLLIMCRDEQSYNFCRNKITKNCIYTPDIVMTLKYDNLFKKMNKDILYCFRDDKEKTSLDKKQIIEYIEKNYKTGKFSTVFENNDYKFSKGKKDLIKLLNKISNTRLIVTDRLHAMLFAAITGTRCIAFDNKSNKVKGAYNWIKKNNNYVYFVNTQEEFIKVLEKIDIKKVDRNLEYNNKEYIKIIKNGLEK